SKLVSGTLDYREVLEIILSKSKELVQSENCIIYGVDRGGTRLVPLTYLTKYQVDPGSLVINVGEGITGDVALTGKGELVERAGYHPVSSITETHTGHPFGPEGYKTVAYELYRQLGGRMPAAVFVPTAYAELLYGVWLGFKDLQRVGAIGPLPQMIACEPAAGAPLRAALAAGKPVVTVDEAPTAAYSIVVGSNSYRGVLAVHESEGDALALTDEEIAAAQTTLGREGLWAEFSGAAGLAGLRQAVQAGMQFDGPVVCLMTSSGLKDQGLPTPELPPVAPTWDAVRRTLVDYYGLTV
ncbi:MAG TPA: pyridoxal-phosphate dependent enzyme, partial [Promineifilum sp.]|nr:pyridoxal-phosphate dependent enzyme [Promineifilum sp.]